MKMLPVFICRQPEACAAVSACIERTTQRSSANFAVCGKRLLISSPLCPCCVNGNGDCMRWPMGRPFEPTLASPAYGSPWCLVSSGFGSNVSTWLGPPFMKRKTQCFAFAGKCGGFASSGDACASKSVSASPANPPPTCQRNSRRGGGGGGGVGGGGGERRGGRGGG